MLYLLAIKEREDFYVHTTLGGPFLTDIEKKKIV